VRALHAPLPGRGVLLVGLTGTLAVASVDLLLSGRLTMFFDLAFITLCLWLGRLPARDASYVVAFVPPLLLVGVFAILGAVRPGLLEHPGDGVVQAVIAGLTDHAGALAVGYALCLGALGARLSGRLSPRTG